MQSPFLARLGLHVFKKYASSSSHVIIKSSSHPYYHSIVIIVCSVLQFSSLYKSMADLSNPSIMADTGPGGGFVSLPLANFVGLTLSTYSGGWLQIPAAQQKSCPSKRETATRTAVSPCSCTNTSHCFRSVSSRNRNEHTLCSELVTDGSESSA